MRLNKYIASATGLSRRAGDEAIRQNRVLVNNFPPSSGQQISVGDTVTLDGTTLTPVSTTITIMLNKPAGYVCSREGQGSRTIYDLLPDELHHLKPVGRLDKDTGGLLLMTNDGNLAQQLTHPSYEKIKVYDVRIDPALAPLHRQMISDHGIQLSDGTSKLQVDRLIDGDDTAWQITMHEGRNRQIRRTFESLGYVVEELQRIAMGEYKLDGLKRGTYKES